MNYLITGASSDIGIEITMNFRKKEGNRILAVSRKELELFKTFESNNFKYLHGLDLSSEKDIIKLKNEILAFFKESFTLIHCVGSFWLHKSIDNTSFTEVDEMIKSHYITLYFVLKAIIPELKKHGGGRIVAFSCNSVGYNYPEMTAFTSAKSAVETLIKCIANENSKYGIIANAIALSTIRTTKVEELKNKRYHENYITIEELLEVIDNIIKMSPLVNGNVVKLLKYSDSFYNEGYFQRNPSITKN